MIALLGLRFYIMDEVTKIKRKIDFLLDRRSKAGETQKSIIDMQIKIEAEKLKGYNDGKS